MQHSKLNQLSDLNLEDIFARCSNFELLQISRVCQRFKGLALGVFTRRIRRHGLLYDNDREQFDEVVTNFRNIIIHETDTLKFHALATQEGIDHLYQFVIFIGVTPILHNMTYLWITLEGIPPYDHSGTQIVTTIMEAVYRSQLRRLYVDVDWSQRGMASYLRTLSEIDELPPLVRRTVQIHCIQTTMSAESRRNLRELNNVNPTIQFVLRDNFNQS